ncbi:CAF17-like 4Fe-4S cluster assembly/insertion protein YgfZ [Inhella gelatinilytica]|uniref:Folate-binding protein YgfZ n=1 Tax=Inhella gelatinilytica TaxID=2795030 RepID=A0A931IZZ3_9BURK|nr:folate-binding protein YgfZ [Inhella gelatinilytica]MBH9553043.1 folate-binding protein YgfZ [Inhella gelatinilytica]
MSTLPHGITPLPEWGLVRAEGADAAAFLHGQLTQSVTDLPEQQARLAGYCSAKGRLMANPVLLRESPDHFALILPRELATGLAKRLTMFVLRAKAKLRDASAETALYGLLGNAVPAEQPVWSLQAGLLRLPDSLGQRRAWVFGSPPEALPALPHGAWEWAEVHAGLPWVRQATAEHFVPQMINWELLDGVNFKKGCYPGQEVVARSQYRGTVKRRTQLLTGAQAAPATEIFAGEDREQAVGEVVAGAQWDGQSAVLAEVQLSAWESEQPLHLADGRALTRAALPYLIKAPE